MVHKHIVIGEEKERLSLRIKSILECHKDKSSDVSDESDQKAQDENGLLTDTNFSLVKDTKELFSYLDYSGQNEIYKVLMIFDGDGIFRDDFSKIFKRLEKEGCFPPVLIVTSNPDHLYNEIGKNSNWRSNCLISKPDAFENALFLMLDKGNSNFELYNTKQQLRHCSKIAFVGELTSSIVHDLGNPLTLIEGNSDKISKLLSKDEWDLQMVTKAVDRIKFGNQRIKKLVKKMKNFTRKEGFSLTNGSMEEILDNVLILLSKKLSYHGVKIENSIPESFPSFWGDVDSIEQVFMNLISNACDSMEKFNNCKIFLDGNSDKDFIYISVRDTGSGISDQDLKDIFAPFFTTKGKDQGTGLGLSICKQIVMDNKGSIEVSSELGKGTVFTVKLPRYYEEKVS